MKTLWINACVRAQSRTRRLTEYLLDCLGGEVEELRLETLDFPKVDAAFLSRRDALIAAGCWDDPMFVLARQFKQAEQIVVSAPYWDLSEPEQDDSGAVFSYLTTNPPPLQAKMLDRQQKLCQTEAEVMA